MLTLILVRHGESEHNAARRYCGHGDSPLTSAGWAQALALRQRLAPLVARAQPRAVSSDLGRAVDTARIALPQQRVALDARLRELDLGEFEGRTHEICLSIDQDRYRAWLGDPTAFAPPGGEAFTELESRVLDWLNDQPRTGVTIAITHAGPIFALMACLLGETLEVARFAGVAHGDGVQLLVPAHPSARVPTPVWLSDDAEGCGRSRARERLAHARLHASGHAAPTARQGEDP